jgi:hypothetical protein
MSFVRSALVSVAVAGMIMSGEVVAQTPAPAPAPDTSAPAKEPAKDPAKDPSTAAKIQSKADEVAKWTKKEWSKAKTEWAKEKEKWADCQKQSKDQKLTGRKNWSFLSSCMTSST